jgi:hypothetical protein
MGYLKIIIIEKGFEIFLPAIYQQTFEAQVSVKNYHDNVVFIPVIIW